MPCNPSPRARYVEILETVDFAMFARDKAELFLRVLIEQLHSAALAVGVENGGHKHGIVTHVGLQLNDTIRISISAWKA